jgi:hypothetical protein
MPTTKQKYVPLVARQFPNSPQENSWLALRAAREKAAHAGDPISENSIVVALYSKARTHFSAKC